MRSVRPKHNPDNRIDRFFRDNLRHSATPPPSDAWEDIERQLDEQRELIKYDHWYYALLAVLLPLTILNFMINYGADETTGLWTAGEEYGVAYKALDRSPLSNIYPEQLSGLNWSKSSGSIQRFDNAAEEVYLAMNGSRGTLEGGNAAATTMTTAYTALNNNDNSDRSGGINGSFHAANFMNTASLAVSASSEEEDILAGALAGIGRIDLDQVGPYDDEETISGLRTPKGRTKDAIQDQLNEMQGFHFGFDYALNNTHMKIKESALYPLVGGDIDYKFDWGTSYGLSFGYAFSDKHGLEMEWIVNSAQGQRYVDNRRGKLLIDGEIDLSYMHFPLMYKRKWASVAGNTLLPTSFNILAGLEYSRLKSATIVMNETPVTELDELFPKNELGVVLGMEYDIYIHKNYYVSLGARGSIATNATAFPYVNADKAKTYNYLVGVNASLNYSLGRRHNKK